LDDAWLLATIPTIKSPTARPVGLVTTTLEELAQAVEFDDS
jgi:hypothetical protein